MRTFWSKGYEGTSMSDLERSMGLARTSIYNAFGNKRQLFDKAVEYYQRTILADLLSPLESSGDIHQRINKLLNNMVDFQFREDTPGGCLVVLSIFEREQHTTPTVAMLEQQYLHCQNYLQQKFEEAQRSGEIREELDTLTLSTTLMASMAGIMVMRKAGFSETILRQVANMTGHLFAGANTLR